MKKSLWCLSMCRTWPMRLYWPWARRLRWPISWLCRPRGPNSSRVSPGGPAQTSSRPDPVDLYPSRGGVFASQGWVGRPLACMEATWKHRNELISPDFMDSTSGMHHMQCCSAEWFRTIRCHLSVFPPILQINPEIIHTMMEYKLWGTV